MICAAAMYVSPRYLLVGSAERGVAVNSRRRRTNGSLTKLRNSAEMNLDLYVTRRYLGIRTINVIYR